MEPTPPLEAVQHFYDFHPISAEQIFSAIAARQIAREDITQAVLSAHDQDHYGGTDAVDRLMAQALITDQDHVLDVCAGMGGPARYIAWKTGCRVTGLDLTAGDWAEVEIFFNGFRTKSTPSPRWICASSYQNHSDLVAPQLSGDPTPSIAAS
jgi:cyclopropane fatty-acyl-phospholipid synthase-like methyltransferase